MRRVTDAGVIIVGAGLDTYHGERHLAGTRTMLHTQAQVALRHGHDPAAEALRELLGELLADEQPLRRIGALIAGNDIRCPMPGTAQHPLAGAFAPDLTLHTDRAAGQDPARATLFARLFLVSHVITWETKNSFDHADHTAWTLGHI
jgi:hypothetical protein